MHFFQKSAFVIYKNKDPLNKSSALSFAGSSTAGVSAASSLASWAG